MNVSSIFSNSSLYSTLLNNNKTQNNISDDSEDSLLSMFIEANEQSLNSSVDGDTYVSNVSSGSESSSSSFNLKDFLDKVKNGTVTDEDLEEAQEALQNMPQPPGRDGSDPIGSFLEKVKSGTITEEDLTDMQTTLGNMPEPPEDQGADPIKALLDKVKNGTVTSTDLAMMQVYLAQQNSDS